VDGLPQGDEDFHLYVDYIVIYIPYKARCSVYLIRGFGLYLSNLKMQSYTAPLNSFWAKCWFFNIANFNESH